MIPENLNQFSLLSFTCLPEFPVASAFELLSDLVLSFDGSALMLVLLESKVFLLWGCLSIGVFPCFFIIASNAVLMEKHLKKE